jgi:hypothetical protein
MAYDGKSIQPKYGVTCIIIIRFIYSRLIHKDSGPVYKNSTETITHRRIAHLQVCPDYIHCNINTMYQVVEVRSASMWDKLSME